ncbi:hypothetical protein [Lentzea sp. NEAU-D7]|uniref:hypothetical protein n=1 Tax=Lentzea sp. NEAU-D7 TaxID=2994667 RepID=UPI00224B18DA|nr:hypothetical protein [Lentzea sp. NEAU-D7]MCX2952131.1 hypothetical protein [Lentzea sp. NEAU-D7]
MDDLVIDAARRSLAGLVGERWRCVGRACDLVWLGFGAVLELPDHRGGTREVAEFALHLQGAWRVHLGDERLTGASDIRLPPPGWTGDGEFDWDVQGTNRFDVRAAKLTTHLRGAQVVVTSVEVDGDGDLTVFLSDGFRIEARCGGSGREGWRFFRPGDIDSHVVMPPEE